MLSTLCLFMTVVKQPGQRDQQSVSRGSTCFASSLPPLSQSFARSIVAVRILYHNLSSLKFVRTGTVFHHLSTKKRTVDDCSDSVVTGIGNTQRLMRVNEPRDLWFEYEVQKKVGQRIHAPSVVLVQQNTVAPSVGRHAHWFVIDSITQHHTTPHHTTPTNTRMCFRVPFGYFGTLCPLVSH